MRPAHRRPDPLLEQTALGYERERPGELVDMDVKKVGKIPDSGGWRAHGRSDEVRGRGNDYVHSVVDDHYGLAYSEILPDEKARPARPFWHARANTSVPTASPASSTS